MMPAARCAAHAATTDMPDVERHDVQKTAVRDRQGGAKMLLPSIRR